MDDDIPDAAEYVFTEPQDAVTIDGTAAVFAADR
jgi:hypothetical protein